MSFSKSQNKSWSLEDVIEACLYGMTDDGHFSHEPICAAVMADEQGRLASSEIGDRILAAFGRVMRARLASKVGLCDRLDDPLLRSACASIGAARLHERAEGDKDELRCALRDTLAALMSNRANESVDSEFAILQAIEIAGRDAKRARPLAHGGIVANNRVGAFQLHHGKLVPDSGGSDVAAMRWIMSARKCRDEGRNR